MCPLSHPSPFLQHRWGQREWRSVGAGMKVERRDLTHAQPCSLGRIFACRTRPSRDPRRTRRRHFCQRRPAQWRVVKRRCASESEARCFSVYFNVGVGVSLISGELAPASSATLASSRFPSPPPRPPAFPTEAWSGCTRAVCGWCVSVSGLRRSGGGLGGLQVAMGTRKMGSARALCMLCMLRALRV